MAYDYGTGMAGAATGAKIGSMVMPGFGTLAGGVLGGLGGLFGGGMQDPSKAAQPYLNKIPGTISPYYQPYINAGNQALPGLQNMYNQMMQDPNAIISRLGAGYQQSPGYQWQLGQGQQAINNAAAAGGMAGSPMHQQQAGQLATNLANQDYESYLNHVLGLLGGGLTGQQGMAQMGYGASNDLATNLAQQLMSQANLAYAGTANRNQSTGGLLGGVMGMFGGGGKGFFG